MDYADDMDNSIFVFERYGKAMRPQKIPVQHTHPDSDIHVWDTLRDQNKFDKDFHINPDIDKDIRAAV